MVTMAGMVKWFKHHSLLILIVIPGLSLRLINLQSWFQFEFDEEVIAWKLREFVTTGKPFLIGGGTPFGFHLGPGFYYLSAIPLWFFRLDPIGWGIVAAVFGAVTIWLMWLVGKTLYSQRIGLTAALLWATSFTAVMTDRHWWPLVLDPMLSLIVILCLFHILGNEKFIPRSGILLRRTIWWWVILGLTLAFALQADLTVLPLFLATGVIAVLSFRRQWKGVLTTIVILLISTLPLILFEFRHPGANLGKFIQGSNPSVGGLDLNILVFIPQSLSRLLFPIANLDGNLLKFYSWCREIVDARIGGQPWWAVGLTALILLTPFFYWKFRPAEQDPASRDKLPTQADKVLRIVILSGVVGIFIFRSRGGNLYDFYLAVLYPVVLLLAARILDFIWEKWGKIVAIAGLGIIVGLNLLIITKANHPQGLAVKRQAVAWVISNVGKEEFDLESISNCSRYNGVRYLFILGEKEPQQSFVDPELSWLYDKKGDYMKPKYLATFVTPDDLTPEQNKKYNQLKLEAVGDKVFSSSLEVIISKHD